MTQLGFEKGGFMLMNYNRAVAVINLDAIYHNIKKIKEKICTGKIICIIKADGYGHGAIPLAMEYEKMDEVSGYGVATIEEAILLRKAGIKKNILVLGYIFPEDFPLLFQWQITPTIFEMESARLLQECAIAQNTNIKIHVKVDTGMSRIGIAPDENGFLFVNELFKCNRLLIEGIFTHFSRADEEEKSVTEEQLGTFYGFVNRIEEESGFFISQMHFANSAAIIELESQKLDLVRAGIILYGLWPSEEVRKEPVPIEPVLSLYSKVIFVKEVKAGTAIGYGGTYVAESDITVATIPIGYGDGYPRALSNKGYVLIKGKKASIIGRICMDQFMVDVTNIPDVSVGEQVTLIGKDFTEQITMEELGELSGRFNYELSCDLGKRIPRVYTKKGKIVYKKDCFNDFLIEIM